ncbi:dienelactone hydrolase family protein [Burkholderia thailandensis]|uniref:Alpha/beta hydrolase family protein n=2 Tax=Burkholderia thailandensis TaxID=57975 RepID=A0AAW9CU99_BURTH|nr:dienelactone hydrolase family protein [Burkholderia thailandensis]ABC39337.1 carboxymethylenebutenolidase [Burkholderia thailandensis E264]AHI64261.1 dienelactone hydrolase family protein [Burkholderia thailandensis H0587]AHI73556.1 dienelactone hydrolase family protein [Burkholderia thailandensis 2002721723]AIP28576.1 dienelactone hydrolase family protein [Burkholderia thailandensis E264]AIP64387.1 carboxymethylenebutenolidase [Burkholderia thailandensis]
MASQWIDIPAGNDTFGGYLALPKRGRGPAIVIIQEIFGVNGHIRSVADQYAADGYVALAPDVFWRTQPRVELGYEGADRDKGIELLQKTDVVQAVADIGAAAAALRARPEVAGKLAAIGYCFGGRLAYLAAAQQHVDVAVAYYGGGIQNQVDVAAKVTQPILFHYAGHDQSIPLDAVDKVKAAFAGRANAEFHLYPDAQHGFNCSERASYDQRAAALAHGRTLTFLAERL